MLILFKGSRIYFALPMKMPANIISNLAGGNYRMRIYAEKRREIKFQPITNLFNIEAEYIELEKI